MYGLIVDPGAAHALIGSDTLLDFMRQTGVTPIQIAAYSAGTDPAPVPDYPKEHR